MIKLNKYLQDEYIDKKGMLKSKAVENLALDFNVTYGTVYRWLKTDDYFVLSVSDKGSEYKTVYKYTAGN